MKTCMCTFARHVVSAPSETGRGHVFGSRTGEGGYTIAEVLMAMALLAIGFIGLAAGLNLQTGVSSGASVGLAAITRSNSLTIAAMLAQARLEEIRNSQYTLTLDQITATNFPNEGYGAISNYPAFRRTVVIQNGVPAAQMKTISMQAFFRPAGFTQEQTLTVSTIMAQRS